MSKVALFPVLLAAGCVLSGIYGAVHDQLSYTVSPDYFHHLKFHQFDIPPHLHNRTGAALVGWYATWWMGLFIGIPVLTIGLTLPDARTYLTRSLVAFAVVAGTALAVGLGGLALASAFITRPTMPPSWYPPGVADRVAFDRVGVMHTFGYLGGFLGILTGSGYLLEQRARLRPVAGMRSAARRVGGGIFLVAGLGLIGLMLWDLARMQLGLVPSADIAMTYWVPVACVLLPVGSVMALGGWVLVLGRVGAAPQAAEQEVRPG